MPTSPHCYGIIQRGMSTVICVFFVRRVDDNDTAWDVLGHLSHILSASTIPAGKVDTCSEERTGDDCIVQPVKNSAVSRDRASFPFYILLPNFVLLYALRRSPVVQRDDAHYFRARSMVSYERSFRDVGESHA